MFSWRYACVNCFRTRKQKCIFIVTVHYWLPDIRSKHNLTNLPMYATSYKQEAQMTTGILQRIIRRGVHNKVKEAT